MSTPGAMGAARSGPEMLKYVCVLRMQKTSGFVNKSFACTYEKACMHLRKVIACIGSQSAALATMGKRRNKANWAPHPNLLTQIFFTLSPARLYSRVRQIV